MNKVRRIILIVLLVFTTVTVSGCIIDMSEKGQKHPPMKW